MLPPHLQFVPNLHFKSHFNERAVPHNRIKRFVSECFWWMRRACRRIHLLGMQPIDHLAEGFSVIKNQWEACGMDKLGLLFPSVG